MNRRMGHINGVIVAIATVTVVIISNVPYAILDSDPPPGMVFSGISTNVPDVASYLMWSRQHADGKVLVHNRMTTEPHRAILPNPVWMMVGWFKALTGSSILFAFHFLRGIFTLIYLPLLFTLLYKIFGRLRHAWTAWIVISLGGGLGWLRLIGADIPSADWMTELWSFSSIMHYPHFVFSLLMIVVFFLLSIRANEKKSRACAIGAGTAVGLLMLVHPYTAGTLVASMTLFWLFSRWKGHNLEQSSLSPARTFPWMIAASLPVMGALLYQTMTNPMVAAWARQNVMTSPPIWEYITGFGLSGVLALIVIYRALRRHNVWNPLTVFLIFWIGTALILAYADPIVPFARRCMEGVHIPIVVLAVTLIAGFSTTRVRTAFTIALVVLAVPSVVSTIEREITPDNPGFVAGDMDNMIDAVRYWVGDGNVVSDPRTSLFIAAVTDASVYAAHHEVTPDFENKVKNAYRFMAGKTTLHDRLNFMKSARCEWVVATPYVMYNQLIATDQDETYKNMVREYARGTTWVLVGPADRDSEPNQ